MKSKKFVRNLSISDEMRDRVLFQGNLGTLDFVSIIDSTSLEVIGSNGVLRIEISEDVLGKVLSNVNRELRLTEKGSKQNEKVGKKDYET